MAKHIRCERRMAGFSLIELMVALGIGAILLSVALPTFLYEIRKSRRTDARTSLLDLAGRAERLYGTTNSYQNSTTGTLAPSDLGYPAGPWPITVGSGYYSVNLTLSTPAQFAFTATAIGTQALDTTCVTFTVDNTGNQTSADNNNNNTTSTCWN